MQDILLAEKIYIYLLKERIIHMKDKWLMVGQHIPLKVSAVQLTLQLMFGIPFLCAERHVKMPLLGGL